jgi:ferredoxin
MCTFCVNHGDGKRWYLNAQNYAADLESDLRRRGFMVGFVQGFEKSRKSIAVGLGALRLLPRPIRQPIAASVSRTQQREHFGQPVSLEDCEKILDLATQVTRLPCVCRGAMQPGSNAASCCLVVTATPHDGVVREVFQGYQGGPEAEGFEKLTKAEALVLLRRCEEEGLAHTAWTFHTPFVAALCNCDLPSGCLAMNVQLRGGVRVMWKGEDVARLDADRCTGCAQCLPACPFGALRKVAKGQVALDRQGCWGCGTCRAHCARGALALEPRALAPDVAASW